MHPVDIGPRSMPLRVLTVCTANVCRSPMAAVLIAVHFAANGLDAVVTSCGTEAGIVASDPNAIEVMAERGLSIAEHRPRRLTRDIVVADGTDLIVTMTRSHLRAVALYGPAEFRRAFTAKELVRRAIALPSTTKGGDIAAWRTELGEERAARGLLGESREDDIDDPYGGPIGLHRRTADELDALAAAIAHSLAGWCRIR